MAPFESEPMIEAVGIRPGFVRGQLDQATALRLGKIDRVAKQHLANALTACPLIDPYRLNLCSRHTETREARDDRQLQAADHSTVLFGDENLVAGLSLDRGEGRSIGLRQWLFETLSSGTQGIGREQPNDRRQVSFGGRSNFDGLIARNGGSP